MKKRISAIWALSLHQISYRSLQVGGYQTRSMSQCYTQSNYPNTPSSDLSKWIVVKNAINNFHSEKKNKKSKICSTKPFSVPIPLWSLILLKKTQNSPCRHTAGSLINRGPGATTICQSHSHRPALTYLSELRSHERTWMFSLMCLLIFLRCRSRVLTLLNERPWVIKGRVSTGLFWRHSSSCTSH